MTDTVLSARDLTRRFAGREVVRGVSFELARGEALGFLGPNGAGKTTTMQMLTGNLAPSAGSVTLGGYDLLADPRAAKARLGYLPETPPLYPELTVDEYLTLAARLHRLEAKAIPAAVTDTRHRCGLEGWGKKLLGHLSKGYRQRVGIAQAIVHHPAVVILDEPTVGLDPLQTREIRALVRELAGAHGVLLSTHLLGEAEAVCDRVQVMREGRILHSDTVAALKKRCQPTPCYRVMLRQPPAPDVLAAIPGVRRVEAVEGGWLLHHTPEDDPAEAIARAAAEGGWGLTQLQADEATLEDAFLHLTREEAP